MGLRTISRLLRVSQYAKNLLVFVPLIVSHRIGDASALASASLAFLAFSAAASAGYVLNDLRDAAEDRHHPRKRSRPIAAGLVQPRTAYVWFVALVVVAAVICTSLPVAFAIVLLTYLTGSATYTSFLKRRAVVDVIGLAGLYTTRVVAGAVAVQVEPSFWLLAFSMFTFFSLALVKRYCESADALAGGRDWLGGRAYRSSDLHLLMTLGTASAMTATVVLALYLRSPDVQMLYRHPQLLWALCPINVYWTARIWLKAQRGEVLDDPLVFAVRDRTTYLVGFVTAAVIVLATF